MEPIFLRAREQAPHTFQSKCVRFIYIYYVCQLRLARCCEIDLWWNESNEKEILRFYVFFLGTNYVLSIKYRQLKNTVEKDEKMNWHHCDRFAICEWWKSFWHHCQNKSEWHLTEDENGKTPLIFAAIRDIHTNVQCKYRKSFHLTASHFSIDKFTWAITTAFSVLQHRFSRVSVSVQITQFITQFCEHNTNSATLPWCCVPFSIV